MISTWITVFLIHAYFQFAIGSESALTAEDLKSGIKIGPSIEVTMNPIYQPYTPQTYGPGVVNGFRSCGGPGQLYTVLYETCSGDHSEMCQVPADSVPRPAELHFSPSADLFPLGIRVIAMTQGISPTNIFEKKLDSMAVSRGYMYSLSARVAASKMFRGRAITLVFEIYRDYDQQVEVCGQVDFKCV